MNQPIRNIILALAILGAIVLVLGLAQGGLSSETTGSATCEGTDPLCGADPSYTPILTTVAGAAMLALSSSLWAVDRWRRSRGA